MEHAFGFWAKNSVGDIMDMVMQALEVIACELRTLCRRFLTLCCMTCRRSHSSMLSTLPIE